MKTIFVLAFAFLSFTGNAQPKKPGYLFAYFKNNGEDGLHYAASEDGLVWKTIHDDRSVLTPVIGKDRLMRDPCIIRGADGWYHMVWTTGWTDHHIGYAKSKDLVHWSEQQSIPVMEHEPTARNSWAPELTYDPATRQYMIYWSSTIPGRFQNQGSEDNYNHRIYYTLTKDFQAFTPTRLLIDPGFNCIDATIVPDGEGYRVFLKDETLTPPAKNLHTGTAKKITGPYTVEEKPITGAYWAEGPTTIRPDGRWIVYFDKYQLAKYGAVTSTDGTHWVDISEQLVMPEGLRHGTILALSTDELNALKAVLQ